MSIFKKIVKLCSKYKIHIAVLLIGIPVISKLDIWSQTMLGSVIDQISYTNKWLYVMGKYAIAATVLFVVKQGYSWVEQKLVFRVTYRLRYAIAEKVLHVNSRSLLSYTTDDIMHMWNQDVEEMQTISITSILNYGVLFISALLALMELRTISLYFPIIALVVNILAVAPLKIIGQKTKKQSQRQRDSQVAMNAKFYTILNAIRLVKSYGKEKKEIAEFDTINHQYVDDKMAFSISTRIYKSVVTAVKSIAPTLILLIANFEIRDGRMTVGDIVLATSLLETISKPFSEGGTFFVNLKGIGFKFEHLFQFLEEEGEEILGEALVEAHPYEIELKNVSFQKNGVSILKDINLHIGEGQKIGIVGESGSGKTTLNHLILRINKPTEGKISLNGRNLSRLDLCAYRSGIHYSQSNTYIANATIMQNLTLLGVTEEASMQMAKEIGFHEEIIAMPEGYNTVIDASGSNISGGQKKKIAIIRALTQKRQLYVLDEITRGIDETSAKAVMEYMLNHVATTMIFTMHNFYEIERMDKVVVMKAGQIIAEGKHGQLYEDCSYYRELYDSRRRDKNGA